MTIYRIPPILRFAGAVASLSSGMHELVHPAWFLPDGWGWVSTVVAIVWFYISLRFVIWGR